MKTMRFNWMFTSTQKKYTRYVLGALIFVYGLLNMISTFTPQFQWRVLFEAWPVDTRYHITVASIVVSYFLLVVPYGLIRGKRQTWRITMMLLLTSILLNVLRGGLVILTTIAILLFVLLLIFDYCFEARSDPASILRGYLATALGLGIVIIYSLGGFLALYNLLHLPVGSQNFLFGRALPLVAFCAFLFGASQILSPIAKALLPNTKQRQDATELVHDYGTNSIAYFALAEDKTYFFSASGKAFVSYALKEGVAVVAGDPIGPKEELPIVLNEFVNFCHKQDWTPAFWQVRNEDVDMYRKLGFSLLKIGEDGIIHTATFTLKGKAMSNVRTSARRAEKEGLRVVFYQGAIEDANYLTQLEQISNAWLAEKGGSEMSFSLGRFETHPADEQITAIAVDATERVHAFVTFLPIYGRQGYGLDLMRRAGQTAPGTMELLLSLSIDYLKGRGAEMISLGLAPMGNVNQENQTSLKSIVDFLTHRFGNLSQSQSLFKFKEKFHPTWESRYLVYPNALSLPKVGLALYEAHQPDTSWLATARKSIQEALEKHSTATKEQAKHPEATVHPGTGSLAL